jgi:carbamoyl-phosphate synthase large subunit
MRAGLLGYMGSAVKASDKHPVLIDKYLRAIEVDADAICDSHRVVVAGIAGNISRRRVALKATPPVRLPPYSLDETVVRRDRRQMTALALELVWSAS